MSSASQEQPSQSPAKGQQQQQQQPPPEQVAQALEAVQAARRFQDVADALKKQASLATDPAEREKLWRAAYIKEKEAHGESRKARIMASGWGQGAGLAVGISSAVGMGLGNLVGALLSGVVAVPGVLVGSGVGALHGPWYKFKDMLSSGEGDENKDKENEKIKAEVNSESEDESSEDIQAHLAIVEAARQMEEEKKTKGNEGGGTQQTPPPAKKQEDKTAAQPAVSGGGLGEASKSQESKSKKDTQ